MASDKAPMLAASRAVPDKIGYYACCERHASWGIWRGRVRRNRRREKAAWRREAERER